jgi:glycerol-3-phosphate dehydrogenase
MGVTLVGSTDLDHNKDLDIEASITQEEVDYLLAIVHYQFPALAIDRSDIVSTYAGVRPVIGTGALDPSSEKREHSIWVERGLISVSGGKLTTFRLIALDVLKRAAPFIPSLSVGDTDEPVFSKISPLGTSFQEIDSAFKRRLMGRYGIEAEKVAQCARDGELTRIPGTDTLWVELRWGARTEAVAHLEDLLLRRTRLGVVLAHGGEAFFDRIKVICQEELGWDENRWQDEAHAYKNLWQRCYSVPGCNQ